jgi:hypothetical protein
MRNLSSVEVGARDGFYVARLNLSDACLRRSTWAPNAMPINATAKVARRFADVPQFMHEPTIPVMSLNAVIAVSDRRDG